MNKVITILVLLMSFISTSLFASDWSMVRESSYLKFLSTKKSTITEQHHFKVFNVTVGDLSDNQRHPLVASVQLDSVETAIPIRNQRMQSMLFKVARFPVATLSTSVPALERLFEESNVVDLSLPGKLTIKGTTKALDVALRIVKLADGQLVASTADPILVNAEDFGLAGGVKALKAAAGLDHIATVVPIYFSIHFINNG